MNCEACGVRTATVRYAEVVDGAVSTWNLCEECARERGVGGSLTSLAAPLVNILMGLLDGAAESGGGTSGRTCPSCGLSYGEFRSSGRLGCASCYEAFAEDLRPLVRRIHGSTEHRGAVPSGLEDGHVRRRELSKLESQLEVSVRKEEYERAAELRDLIRSRQKELERAERDDVDVCENDE